MFYYSIKGKPGLLWLYYELGAIAIEPMSEQASGERLYSNKMLWSPNDDVLDSGMTLLERNGFKNHELSINDASLWTELNYTVQSYRLSSVDSSVADFIVNSNPVHSKDYIFDQADSIGVLHHSMVLRMHH